MAGQLTIDTLKASSGILATQNGMTGIAKAWVNFDPSSGSSATIRASFNVSSVTYVTTGNYTLNFTTAFPDSYYSVAGAAKFNGTSNSSALRVVSIGSNAATQANSQTTTTLDVCVTYVNGGAQDPYTCTVVCFR